MKEKQDRIAEILRRGVEQIIVRRNLERKLRHGQKLRVKHGIDPTGPKIHIGRAFHFWKLKDFQDLGHQVVLIIGDFTAQIGDASDKQSKRPILTEKQIKENMKDYLPQIGKILDLKKTEVHYNSEWLNKLSALELLKLTMNFTAQQMIQRHNFKQRWEQGKEIGLHELSYPVLQGYDSVAIKADLEIGGSDQLFNFKVGRKMQEIFGQEPQDIMTHKMLIGLDGRKMSTSWGNVVNIIDEPNDMFGKIMSMKDEIMPDYFQLATRLSQEEIQKILKQEPRQAKTRLAGEIVALYHGQSAAQKAEKEFNKIFKEKKIPDKMPEIQVSALPNQQTDLRYQLSDLLMIIKLASSKTEAKRLIRQGGIKIDGKVIKDPQKEIKIKNSTIVQKGKRWFVRLKVKNP